MRGAGLGFLVSIALGCARISGADDLEIIEPHDSGASGGATGGSAGSGGSGGVGATGGASGAAGSGLIDYSQGFWKLENISNSPGNVTHDARLVFAGGTPFVAWTDPDTVSGVTGDQDIWAGPIGAVQLVTDDTNESVFASLAVSGGQPWLSWSSNADGDHDIYVAAGASFAPQINVTEPFDPGSVTDYRGSLAAGGDTHAVAYLSRPATVDELWVVSWTTSVTAAMNVPVITDKGSCSQPSAVADGGGKLHVLCECGGAVLYAQNTTGTWAVADVGGGTTGNYETHIALAPDAQTLVASWITGARELLVRSSTLGATWTDPVLVAPGAWSSAIAVDAAGRILVAFEQRNVQNNSDVFFTWSEGSSWAAPIPITPGTDATNESNPTALALDPAQIPVILYEGWEEGSVPLNTDIWRATLVP